VFRKRLDADGPLAPTTKEKRDLHQRPSARLLRRGELIWHLFCIVAVSPIDWLGLNTTVLRGTTPELQHQCNVDFVPTGHKSVPCRDSKTEEYNSRSHHKFEFEGVAAVARHETAKAQRHTISKQIAFVLHPKRHWVGDYQAQG
jgi:hypothetical protein